MTDNDVQVELKKRARRRLVGAVALAMLAAIVLPMVMDQEPKTPVPDIQVRIPGQDAGGFASRILPAKSGVTPTPLPPAGAAPKAGEPPTAADAVRIESARREPAKSEAAKPESPRPEAPHRDAAASPAAPAAAAAKPEWPQPGRSAAPAEDRPAKSAEDKPAKPAGPSAKPLEASARADAPAEKWVVQIGAYRDPANVRNLQAKLKEQGYNFYTEPLTTDGVQKTRVRAGPFPSKEAAEKARERLKRIGVDGVVAPRQ